MKVRPPAAGRRPIAAVLVLGLLATACGGGDAAPSSGADVTAGSRLASAVPQLPPAANAPGAAAHSPAPHARTIEDTLRAVVHHSPTCGCCGKWVDHARAHGIAAEVRLADDIQAVKRELAIPVSVQSCHTTIIGGYIVEGHVPADVIRQLLRERPAVRGIAAPGMPLGSPGMEGPYASQPYDIVAFDERGPTGVFARR